jgi:hypothetical protein
LQVPLPRGRDEDYEDHDVQTTIIGHCRNFRDSSSCYGLPKGSFRRRHFPLSFTRASVPRDFHPARRPVSKAWDVITALSTLYNTLLLDYYNQKCSPKYCSLFILPGVEICMMSFNNVYLKEPEGTSILRAATNVPINDLRTE